MGVPSSNPTMRVFTTHHCRRPAPRLKCESLQVVNNYQHWTNQVPLMTNESSFHSLFRVLFTVPSQYLVCYRYRLDIQSQKLTNSSIRAAISNNSTHERFNLLKSTKRMTVYRSCTYYGTIFKRIRVLSKPFSCKERILYFVTIRSVSKNQQIQRIGLFLVRSPLLKKCLLVSFPTLSNMLKFSVFICLIGGRFF